MVSGEPVALRLVYLWRCCFSVCARLCCAYVCTLLYVSIGRGTQGAHSFGYLYPVSDPAVPIFVPSMLLLSVRAIADTVYNMLEDNQGAKFSEAGVHLRTAAGIFERLHKVSTRRVYAKVHESMYCAFLYSTTVSGKLVRFH